MKEAYVSYEIAKLLKEKGFAEFCLYYYQGDSPIRTCSQDRSCYEWNNNHIGEEWYSCPTQQMACSWLRETQGLWIIPMPCEDGGCYFKIYKRYGKIWKDNVYDHTDYEDFDEPEDAVEAALQYVLTELI